MSEYRNIKFSPTLLRDYSLAALANARELVSEALILYKHGCFARAYFLAVASIEETGKAFLAFDGQGRNLSDSAVASKLKRTMEDHSQKITSAFSAYLLVHPSAREAVMPAIKVIVDLKYGREPAMYTDIRPDSSTIQIPVAVVRENAALDCIKLATECLAHTQVYISVKTPEAKTRAEDQVFAMKPREYQTVMKTEDFWWYYVAEMEAGRKDWAEAVVTYQDKYAKRGILFEKSSKDSGGSGS
ncbi:MULTISPECIES: AbiV family abortive infection protein [Methylocaldum]|jgi:AbiV family abortive infection protein|uniref:AbiV family abortive infection protein n=1 Tax=unclassified Methylocaldum TaxID=2622260 RepID=UPI00098B2EA7|nr:AbiV family abortive infection protein [Methylocaldum sp. 14B]